MWRQRCITLQSFCSSAFCLFFSPIPGLFAASTPHITQLPLAQEPLSLILFHFCPLVVASSALHKCHHFSGCSPPLHTYCCFSWGQPLSSTMLPHFLPNLPSRCHLFLSTLFPFSQTLPLLVSLFSTPKASHYVLYPFLPPYLLNSTLHYSTFQHLELILLYLLLLLLFPCSAIPGEMPKLPTSSTQSSFSSL